MPTLIVFFFGDFGCPCLTSEKATPSEEQLRRELCADPAQKEPQGPERQDNSSQRDQV